VGGWEYNLWNDVTAANVVFRSKVELWQIPSTILDRLGVVQRSEAETEYIGYVILITYTNQRPT